VSSPVTVIRWPSRRPSRPPEISRSAGLRPATTSTHSPATAPSLILCRRATSAAWSATQTLASPSAVCTSWRGIKRRSGPSPAAHRRTHHHTLQAQPGHVQRHLGLREPGLGRLHLGLGLRELAGLLRLEFQPLVERVLFVRQGLDLLLDPRLAGLEFFHERRG